MTQEEKQLLLKDLCARLPYRVKVNYIKEEYGNVNDLTGILDSREVYIDGVICDISDIKPYLRPMSGMTEEERNEVNNLIKCNRPTPYGKINNKGIDNLLSSVSVTSGVLIDWLNAHHFDYRGLIEAGLALEAPEEMYNLNKE